MGWLKKLFQKKPGGSLFGNILRKVGDYVTGGIYSTINPTLPCARVDSQGTSEGLVQVQGFGGFGCSGSGFLFRGGFNFLDAMEGFGQPVETPLGTPPNSFTPSSSSNNNNNSNVGLGVTNVDIFNTPNNNNSNVGLGVTTVDIFNTPSFFPTTGNGSGIIPTSTNNTNPFGLPSNILDMVENLVEQIDTNIDFDFNDIPQSVINTLDNYLGEDPPQDLLNHLGLDSNFNPLPWTISGTVGEVDFQIGDSPNENNGVILDQSQGGSNWFDEVKTWVKTHSKESIAILVSFVALIGGSAYYLTKRKKKRKR